VPDGSTEKPNYPDTTERLYEFCIDGLTDPNAMIRRLNHAVRDYALPASMVSQVRSALWEYASNTCHGGTIGQPVSSTLRGVAWIGKRRSLD